MTRTVYQGRPQELEYIPLDDPQNFFYTYDLGASAALVCVGYELVALDKANPRKVQFIFARTSGIEEAVNEYFSDKLQVRARSLFDNVKMLKNRIYSE